MTLDIRGGLKNTRINNNRYVVVDELLSNAIDSFLIRKNGDSTVSGLKVSFLIEFFPRVLDGSQVEFKITCTDNGAGFGDDQIKAFVTKDTTYKDDLAIEGIGKCKGSGRIQFFHYFSKINIDSTYLSVEGIKRRKLSFDDTSIKEIDEQSFSQEVNTESIVRTISSLDIIKPEIYERFFNGKNLREDFSAETLKQYVMVNFLQRFVSLKERLGEFHISFETVYAGQQESSILVPQDLPEITEKRDVLIHYTDATGQEIDASEAFSISHYKLNKSVYKLKRNFVALCAKSSAATIITNKFLKTKTLENNDIAGFYHIILVESEYLNDHVNEQRDDFNIPRDSQQDDLYLKNMLSFEKIHDAIDEIIFDMLAPPDWDKEKIVKEVSQKYGISSAMISEAKVRVHYGDTEEKVVKRVLSSYQEQIIKDTSEIFDIKIEISKTDPTTPEFREKVNALAWKYTSSLKSIDMANLSQVIVRRAAILEILSLAIRKNLAIQADTGERRKDEKVIHNIFFPVGKDSLEVSDHDIWLLSEEYHYFDYISSDKALSTIRWNDDALLFDSDIDIEMKKLLAKNYDDNQAKRPDIAVFSKEGSVIIIEFKAPGVSLDGHIGDLMEYSQLLAAKSKGKLKRFYGYLIGDTINPNRVTGYTRLPSGKGWFHTEKIIQHDTGMPLGELNAEILFYDDLVDRATKRLEVYKNRLNINFGAE